MEVSPNPDWQAYLWWLLGSLLVLGALSALNLRLLAREPRPAPRMHAERNARALSVRARAPSVARCECSS